MSNWEQDTQTSLRGACCDALHFAFLSLTPGSPPFVNSTPAASMALLIPLTISADGSRGLSIVGRLSCPFRIEATTLTGCSRRLEIAGRL
jgi:hypothetical protein